MNPETVNNYLNNGLKFAQNFAKDVLRKAEATVWEGRYGYGSALGHIGKYAKSAAEKTTNVGKATTAVAGVINDLLTNQTRREWWKYTNVARMAGMVAGKVAEDLGMGGTLAGAALVGAAFPINQALSSGGSLNVKEGFRPKGYKSLVQASVEKDPTGRTPLSPVVEIPLRQLTGRPGDLLPYQEFKKDRPDILPSQYVNYRRYVQKRSKPGDLVTIDPETGTFVTAQGIVKGSVEGLAGDLEIRLMGRPITVSSVAGLGAGYAAMKGLQAATDVPFSKKTQLRSMKTNLEDVLGRTVQEFGSAAKQASYQMPSQVNVVGGKPEINPEYFNQLKELGKNLMGSETYGKKIEHLHKRIETISEQIARTPGPEFNVIQKAGQALGPYKNLAVAGAGIATALGVGYTTKKALQKASEQRIKKSNPVEYLKHKHGSLEAASVALGQPNARSWEQLIPHM